MSSPDTVSVCVCWGGKIKGTIRLFVFGQNVMTASPVKLDDQQGHVISRYASRGHCSSLGIMFLILNIMLFQA